MKVTSPVILFLLATVACPAQWQLIDDFHQWEGGEIFTEATDFGWQGRSESSTDFYWILDDPHDATNKGLYVESADYNISWGNTWIVKELPGGGIQAGSTGTLFLRCLWIGHMNSWNIGTADKPLEFDPETGEQTAPGAWGDFNAFVRFMSDQFDHRDGHDFVPTNPPLSPQENEWYSIWLVVENSWDDSMSPPVSTGTYSLYMSGPGFGDGYTPVLVPVGTIPPKDSARFRRDPADADGIPRSIIWVMFGTNTPAWSMGMDDRFILDDFFFSRGRNLSSPLTPGGGWAGYAISSTSGDVDTGPWLGWLNISQAPYLWSYPLNNWIYMEEPAADVPGAWGYFFK